ncbi:hypothetical protein [Paenibacillus sp. J31TS4]|nr:hypothetical protein [Paenibacillus sp. J31TS4]
MTIDAQRNGIVGEFTFFDWDNGSASASLAEPLVGEGFFYGR